MTAPRWSPQFLRSCLCAACATLVASVAHGSPPWQCHTLERVLLVCPSGDALFHVVAEYDGGYPSPGSTVTLEITGGSFAFAPALAGDPYTFWNPSQVVMQADASGVAAWPLRAGGVTLGGLVVRVDGLATRRDGTPIGPGNAVSPDQDGNLVVDARDLSEVVRRVFRPVDAAADFNGDGVTNTYDLALFMRHQGHRRP
jgi:hypothetical protein